MSTASTREALLQLIRPVVESDGVDLEDIEVIAAGKRRLVRLLVDRDGGLDLDTVAHVSHAASAALDARRWCARAGPLGRAPYVLEVSSPGVDRPLTAPRHWRRARTPTRACRACRRPVGDRSRRPHRRGRGQPGRRRGRIVTSIGRPCAVGARPGRVHPPRAGARDDAGADSDDATRQPAGGLNRGHRHDRPARARAGEGGLLRPARPRHRAGPAGRLPAHRGAMPQRPGRARPHQRARRGVGRGDRRGRRGAPGVRRHPHRVRPDRRDHGEAGDPAAAARRARTRRPSGSSSAPRATSSPASCSRAGTRARCWSTSAGSRPSCPPRSRCRGSGYAHGSRLRCYVVQVRKTMRGPSVTLSRSHPNLVRKLFALEVPEIADGTVEIVAIAREAGHRSKIAVRSSVSGVNAKGSCIGPMGQRVRNVMSELHGEKIDIVDWADDPAAFVGSRAVACAGELGDGGGPRRALGPGHRPRLPALPRHRQGGPERPARRPAHRLAHRHPAGHRPRGDTRRWTADRAVPARPGRRRAADVARRPVGARR